MIGHVSPPRIQPPLLRRRGAVLFLTGALRAWDAVAVAGRPGGEDVVGQLGAATRAAHGHRDPAVREEGRRMYWAMAA